MRVSHPPASLLPTKFLSAPLDATSYSSALAPRAPHLSVHLVQKLVVLHRTSLMALHYLSDSCCRPASICTRFFICKIGMPGSPFLPLLFQWAAPCCRAAPQASFLPLCLCLWVCYLLAAVASGVQHHISHSLPFVSPHASYFKYELFGLFKEIWYEESLGCFKSLGSSRKQVEQELWPLLYPFLLLLLPGPGGLSPCTLSPLFSSSISPHEHLLQLAEACVCLPAGCLAGSKTWEELFVSEGQATIFCLMLREALNWNQAGGSPEAACTGEKGLTNQPRIMFFYLYDLQH